MDKKDKTKVRGKGVLNQKAGPMEDRRTKRNRTRQTKKDEALKDYKD